MVNSLLQLAALLCCVFGMAWLALAIKSHWQQVLGNRVLNSSTHLTLRLLGAGALCLSLLLCLQADHPSMAVLVWVMMLTTSALAVAFILSCKPLLLSPMVAWVRPTRDAG